ETAASLALLWSSAKLLFKVDLAAAILGASQALWFFSERSDGVVVAYSEDHTARKRSTSVSTVGLLLRRMDSWRSRVLAADAKKADSASEATLRIPRPPSLTGRLAGSICRPVKLELDMRLTP